MFGTGGWHKPGEPLEQIRDLEAKGWDRDASRAYLEAQYGEDLAPARRSDILAAVYGRTRNRAGHLGCKKGPMIGVFHTTTPPDVTFQPASKKVKKEPQSYKTRGLHVSESSLPFSTPALSEQMANNNLGGPPQNEWRLRTYGIHDRPYWYNHRLGKVSLAKPDA